MGQYGTVWDSMGQYGTVWMKTPISCYIWTDFAIQQQTSTHFLTFYYVILVDTQPFAAYIWSAATAVDNSQSTTLKTGLRMSKLLPFWFSVQSFTTPLNLTSTFVA